MGVLDEMRFLERQQFFDGQRLFASDLQEVEAFHREMRWLHNESLHQPGIGNGYAVSGSEEDRVITVGAGYALDALGREIGLIDDKELQVPPVSGARGGGPAYFDLVVSYPDDDDLEEAETRAGICVERGVVRLREEPVFCWVALVKTEAGKFVPADTGGTIALDIEQGMKIVIGRVAVQNCQLFEAVSLEQRRNARPAQSCPIVCNEYKPQSWETVWFVDRTLILSQLAEFIDALPAADQGNAKAIVRGFLTMLSNDDPTTTELKVLPFGIQAKVNTEAGSTLANPCYTARVDGSHMGYVSFARQAPGGGNGGIF